MKRTWIVVFVIMLLVGAVSGQLSQTGGAANSVTLAGLVTCDASASLSMSSATTTQAIALSSGKSIYVCGFVFNADGKAAVRLVQGTGSNCGSSQSNLTPAFNLEANGSVALGGGLGRLLKSNAGSALCIVSSTNKPVSALVIYTQF